MKYGKILNLAGLEIWQAKLGWNFFRRIRKIRKIHYHPLKFTPNPFFPSALVLTLKNEIVNSQ